MRIALAGNPNSGKTTMFNALTGSSERVGNWAGVTVEKKERMIKKTYGGQAGIIAVDLPGAYSMSPFTAEESIASSYVRENRPDVIINIVDATNLSRSLFFTTQLLEMGIPMVVALNKSDTNERKKTHIDAKALSELLMCPVVETVSTSSRGLDELIKTATKRAGEQQSAPYVDADVDLTDKQSVAASDRKRFAFVNSIVERVETREIRTNQNNAQDKLDDVLTNKWLGIPIFAVVMFLVFQISQSWLGAWIAEGVDLKNGTVIPGLVTFIDMLGEWVGGLLEGANPLLVAIIVDGIIGGVGAVVGFLPLVMVMYFLLALLEDSGYMARVTVVLDPIFKRVGLSGKSVIPFVVGTGCAVPGVMSSRTIRDERERRATAMLAPFMPCGAKLPVISLFAGAFFGDSRWVGVSMYFIGIVIILLAALLINALNGYKPRKSFFIMELPEYKAPSVKKASVSMCQRGWSYIVKAGTVILVCNFVVQLMQSFGWNLQPVTEASDSILASIATPVAYFFAPVVGVVAWQLAAATITGFIAKENVVGTLAVCLIGLENLVKSDAVGVVGGVVYITPAAALAFLMFNLFSPPCFAAIGAMNAEIKSKKWLFTGIGLQLSVGYTIGFLVYYFGTVFTGARFAKNWIPLVGWLTVAAIVAIFAFFIIKKKREVRLEASQKAQEKAVI